MERNLRRQRIPAPSISAPDGVEGMAEKYNTLLKAGAATAWALNLIHHQ
jgi:hypothetical protein